MLNLVNAVYALIASDSWVDYATIPADYSGDQLPSSPYLRISVVTPSASRTAYSKTNTKKLEGQLLVQIVTEYGRGQKHAAVIASDLDEVLEETWIGDNAQTGVSSLQFVGQDPTDPTKSVYQYGVPVTYIGD